MKEKASQVNRNANKESQQMKFVETIGKQKSSDNNCYGCGKLIHSKGSETRKKAKKLKRARNESDEIRSHVDECVHCADSEQCTCAW